MKKIDDFTGVLQKRDMYFAHIFKIQKRILVC